MMNLYSSFFKISSRRLGLRFYQKLKLPNSYNVLHRCSIPSGTLCNLDQWIFDALRLGACADCLLCAIYLIPIQQIVYMLLSIPISKVRNNIRYAILLSPNANIWYTENPDHQTPLHAF